jgi:hypothetical protein
MTTTVGGLVEARGVVVRDGVAIISRAAGAGWRVEGGCNEMVLIG